MDGGRFSGVLGADEHATHMRISEYVRVLCERYPATGFTRSTSGSLSKPWRRCGSGGEVRRQGNEELRRQDIP